MTLPIKVLLTAACVAALALAADPASARVHHHHHRHLAQVRAHQGRSHHEQAANNARRHGLRGRLGERTLVSHHGRRRAAPVEVATGTSDHGPRRHAALCETVMVHRHWTTHCRGETA